MLKSIRNRVFAITATALLALSFGLNAQEAKKTEMPAKGWQEFHSVSGGCKMNFPSHPQHVTENLATADGEFTLKYDAYIASQNPEIVYMLLIAQYPEFVDESFARMSLEGFLNGILNHNPENQLIFADLVLVDGHEALDFFIRTGSVYFKGRALMVKNSLYLMAMECEMQNYNENSFGNFVNSFKLTK